MDTETYSDDEDIPTPAPDDYNFTSSGGGMFAGSLDFTVVGGTFNNLINTNNYITAPTAPPDFRMIPIGDIDLQQELIVNEESGVVGRRRDRNCVRRVYSATIDGRRSKVTVAVYQGDGAEDDWRRDSEMYMSVRHPNLIQICGGASSGNMHATVFHADLIPLKAFLTPHLPTIKVYLYAYYTEEWRHVNDYFQSIWQRTLDHRDCMLWIRTSTGRLSVDLVPPDITFDLALYKVSVGYPLRQAGTLLNVTEVIAIKSLVLAQYHDICSLYLGKYRHDSISASATVHIGAVTSWPSGHRYKGYGEISLPAEINVEYHSWWRSGGGMGDLMGNGWTRYRANDVFNTIITLEMYRYRRQCWLSQANDIFSHLEITSNLEDYVCIEVIDFILTVGNAREDPPPGYLFFCPKEDFQTGPSSFKWPSCPAYWSLDAKGVEGLSMEKAARLGFPSFQLTTEIQGKAWDNGVYAGLRKFHQGKGFDPDSQDVARHLGHPLYELSADVNSPFTHVDDLNEAEETGEEEVDTDDEWADAQSSLDEGGHDDGSDAEDGVGEDRICAEPHEQQAPKVHQESMDGGYTDTNHETDLKPQPASAPPTGGGFIHRIFGALQHSLVMEVDSDNIDTDPISPFLI